MSQAKPETTHDHKTRETMPERNTIVTPEDLRTTMPQVYEFERQSPAVRPQFDPNKDHLDPS
ncbi:31661_t:CDS:2 [Racocetra persica]|uniref:31661_t:CDS:1 n=1 Tax=Racocetra persica TaxID=160502 RepID=A0ACA9NVJ3_9GLOM|nr:31661_t:CDS:2 [Racocetra persica]